MSVIAKLACSLGRNDEIPNQELAREICRNRDTASIAELVPYLLSGTNAIKSDCIKVLYEIGEAEPDLIAPYAAEFIKLLNSRNNRVVWGAMTALAAIAGIRAEIIFANIESIFETIKKGSVITVDNGVSVLAKVGAAQRENERTVLPFLLSHLETCPPRQVAQHAERSLVMVNADNKAEFRRVLEKRWADLSPSQQARVRKVLQKCT